jgi:hypothetical protein
MIKPEMFNYKDKDSFYNKTINMESATDYDAFIRTCGVRTKSVLIKKQNTERKFMYVLEDILCLAAYNKVKADDNQKKFIVNLWEQCRQSDDFFHSFSDEITKDYVVSEFRNQKVECVSFPLLQAIVYTIIRFLEKELNWSGAEVSNYTNECKYKCCQMSATKEDRIKEYAERKYKKIEDVQNEIKFLKLPKLVVNQPVKEEKRELLYRIKRWINKFI